ARGADILDTLTKAFAAADELAPAAKLLRASQDVRDFLAASLSGAPYLAALTQREPGLLSRCLLLDPDAHLEEAGAELAAAMEAAKTSKDVMAGPPPPKRPGWLAARRACLGAGWPPPQGLWGMRLLALSAGAPTRPILFSFT